MRDTHAIVVIAVVLLTSASLPAAEPEFQLAPAVAVEAEEFRVESGWRVVTNGQGNYMVDIIGFNHISGERLLCVDGKDATASAYIDVDVPAAGNYRLWVRYEYPPFCETRFRVAVEQGGKVRAEKLIGAKDNPRLAFGDPTPKPQYDPCWGPEGLVEESVDVPRLAAGRARIYLKAAEQPQQPGVSAGRHIDLVYLTADIKDTWRSHYGRRTKLYPILDAFRDTRGPRYEARLTNRGSAPADFRVYHKYNRIPWGVSEGTVAEKVEPGKSTGWIALRRQDTCHYHLVTFSSREQPFDVDVRPLGGAVEAQGRGATSHAFYLPPYPGKGDKAVSPVQQIDAVLKHLQEAPAVGRKPTRPLCYGGWMPVGEDSLYGRKYAQLYAAIGMRSLHPALTGPKVMENLRAAGVPPTKSWMVMSYRYPPTPENIARAKEKLAADGMQQWLQWYDYGDEIGFSEWMQLLVKAETARTGEKPAEVVARLWQKWLQSNRRGFKPQDYWLAKWGPVDAAKLRPDSSAEAAAAKAQLYVDSLLFYEETSIAYVAAGARAVKRALGEHVWCGANYSGHPFYYPGTTMYVKWFRRGAADMGRHSEYHWQLGQPGPMVNGYIAEHFRAGMRFNPKAVLRQYTMPHSPGNTEGGFLRTAFTHLAHGAKMLDFFGIGMNDTFTENHIDHRDAARYRAIRDVTHSIGLVEDLLPDSAVVPSQVALLLSESTERWDTAAAARDMAGHNYFGPQFRRTRLHYHLERLGIWKALTFLGESPDLVIEEDLNPRVLAGYKLLIVVGDCLPPEVVPVLRQWVEGGGVLLATAGAGRFDPYRRPNPAMDRLLGLESRQTDERTTFMRPRQELPWIKPLSTLAGRGWYTLQFALHERITPAADAEPVAWFTDDDAPAMVSRPLGTGRVFYVAALPGVAYLWSALQPPAVPDRGPGTHTVPTGFDPGVRAMLRSVLKTARVEPTVVARPYLIDARLIRAPKGYLLPVANYQREIGGEVTLTVRLDAKIKRITSAYQGPLPVHQHDGRLTITIPALGYGDMLRLDF